MRAVLVEYIDYGPGAIPARATVLLSPGWLRRFLGYFDLYAYIERGAVVSCRVSGMPCTCTWKHVATGRCVEHSEHGAEIMRALDNRPVPELPSAMARER